jgi:hypothetical protein
MALQILLTLLGFLLAIASRTSSGFRQAVTRDLVVEISSGDGVARHFVSRNGAVSSHAGRAREPDCVLRFASAGLGVQAFLSRHTFKYVYKGLLEGSVQIQGNPMHLLWFYDLTQRVIPLAESVAWVTPPGAYVTPSDTFPWAKRITREPVAVELDRNWEAAVRQRAKLRMMRVAAGEPTIEF